MTEHTHQNKKRIMLLANFFIPLAGISTDIYLPALPEMMHHFDSSRQMVQLTATLFILSMGFMQLLAGPVSDALGRKKVLIGATLFQALSIILILLSPSIGWIVALRFLQGAGAAFMIVPARALLSDTFEGDALKKQFNISTIFFALGPILGPFIGGYLVHYFEWEACFIFILIYAGIAFFAVLMLLKETIASTTAFSITHLWQNYIAISKNRMFLLFSCFTGFFMVYSTLFNIGGPFIVEVSLGHSPITFGKMALWIGLAWFLGNLGNRLTFSINKITKVTFALIIIFLSAFLMLILSLCGYFNLLLLVLPMFFMIMMSGMIFSLFVGESLAMFRERAASANALLFSITWTCSGLFSIVALLTKTHSLLPMSIICLATTLFLISLYATLHAKFLRR